MFFLCSSGDNCQTVCKPGSVPPRPNSLSGDGHSSGTFVTERLARPTRAAARKARPAALAEASTACRSYLVLLPVGFTLPPPLPAARCALTAPFHPCRPPPRKADELGGVFLWHFPWGRPRRALPGTVPPWSPDFPPCAERTRRRAAIRPSGWEDLGWRAPAVKPRNRSRTSPLLRGTRCQTPCCA